MPRNRERLFITDRQKAAPQILALRLRRIAWMEKQFMEQGPLVTLGVAASILSVSSSRITQLVQSGSLPVVAGFPGGGRSDRYIPLRSLLAAPMPHESGRPFDYQLGSGFRGTGAVRYNPWLDPKECVKPAP